MAMTSLVMIIVILAILLVIGVPISYSIGIASLFTILQTVPLDISVVTGAQRIFVGMSKFSLTAIPFFILAGNPSQSSTLPSYPCSTASSYAESPFFTFPETGVFIFR